MKLSIYQEKDNPIDFLTCRGIQVMRSMVDLHAEEESLVQHLCLNAGDNGENDIQKKLDKIFKKSSPKAAVVAAGGRANNSLPSLLMTSTRVTLNEDLRDFIKEGYSHEFIEIKQKEHVEDRQSWRIVVPNVEDARRQIIEEIHTISYAGHLGYHKTLKKL